MLKKSNKKFLKKGGGDKIASSRKVAAIKRGQLDKLNNLVRKEKEASLTRPAKEPDYIEFYDSTSKKKKGPSSASSSDDFLKKGFFDMFDQDEEETKKAKISTKRKKVEKQEEEIQDLNQQISQHKSELAQLKETDPEFVKFLEAEGDEELMAFQDLDDEDEIFQEELEEEEAEEAKENKKIEVTSDLLDTFEEQALAGSLSALRKLISIFNSATKIGAEIPLNLKFSVTDSHIFTRVLSFVLTQIDSIFRKHLKIKANDQKPCESKHFSQFTNLIKSFLLPAVNFFRGLSEEKMQNFFLQQFESLVPYLAGYARIAKKYLQSSLKVWGESTSEKTKLLAFFNLRQMALLMPYPFIDNVTSGIYLTFVKSAKMTTVAFSDSEKEKTSSGSGILRLMMNCVVEILSIDLDTCHKHAFVFIRQLAIHLRDAITNPSDKFFRIVTSWQYHHSLQVWTLFFSQKNSTMRSSQNWAQFSRLVYPLTQIILSQCTFLRAHPRFIPLIFKNLKMVNEIAEANGIFVNTMPPLFDILRASKFDHKIKKNSDVKFFEGLKVSKRNVDTAQFQEFINQNFFESSLRFFSIYANSISFPELSFPTLIFFKSIKKESKYPPFSQKIAQLCEQIEKNNAFIKAARRNVGIAANNAKEAQLFLNPAEIPPLKTFASQYFQNLKNISKKMMGSLSTTKMSSLIDKGESDSSSSEESENENGNLSGEEESLSEDENEKKLKGKKSGSSKKDKKKDKKSKSPAKKGTFKTEGEAAKQKEATQKRSQQPLRKFEDFQDQVQHLQFSDSDSD